MLLYNMYNQITKFQNYWDSILTMYNRFMYEFKGQCHVFEVVIFPNLDNGMCFNLLEFSFLSFDLKNIIHSSFKLDTLMARKYYD